MHTQKRPGKPLRFIILIPHRDAGMLLDEYRRKLFAAGFAGAYSFPAAAPLARVSRPLSREELKALARNIRALAKGNGGKISGEGTGLIRVEGFNAPPPAAGLFISGPVLDLPAGESLFPESAGETVLSGLFPPVLCAALIRPDENRIPPEALVLSFRAAALANLAIRPLASGEPGYSFEWKIGAPVWLPAR